MEPHMSQTFKIGALTCLLVLASAPACRSADLKSDTADGTHTLRGATVRYFAFTYAGGLTKDDVVREGNAVIDQLRKDMKTCEEFATWEGRFPTQSAKKFAQKRGEVFVVGWVDETKNTWVWIAADRNDDAFPQFKWIASDGKSGMMDSSLASVDPAKAMMSRTFAVGEGTSSLAVSTSAGWVQWAVTK